MKHIATILSILTLISCGEESNFYYSPPSTGGGHQAESTSSGGEKGLGGKSNQDDGTGGKSNDKRKRTEDSTGGVSDNSEEFPDGGAASGGTSSDNTGGVSTNAGGNDNSGGNDAQALEECYEIPEDQCGTIILIDVICFSMLSGSKIDKFDSEECVLSVDGGAIEGGVQDAWLDEYSLITTSCESFEQLNIWRELSECES